MQARVCEYGVTKLKVVIHRMECGISCQVQSIWPTIGQSILTTLLHIQLILKMPFHSRFHSNHHSSFLHSRLHQHY